jgi:hypothetical protein
MKPIMKEHPALHANGNRTIYGYFHKGDIPYLTETYPLIGGNVIARIAGAINAPRLLEVTTILEVAHRYLEKSFSQIRGLSIKAVSNPLSILFWNEEQERVQRVKTRESELMHGACEKLALRTDGVAKVNEILTETFSLRLAFGCSCCAIVVHASDAEVLFASEHYRDRETYGRLFDSDVLCVTGDLLEADSVADVPQDILDASPDFHEAEVKSYLRFARVNEAAVTNNVVAANPPHDARLVGFLKGTAALAA